MQLYKIRSFNDYFSDTIAFFKLAGKHFISNFLIVNGGFLLILAFLYFILGKGYFDIVFSSISNGTSPETTFLETYASGNMGFLVMFGIILLVFSILLSLLSLSYPIIYMKLWQERGGKNFATRDIVAELIKITRRMLLFAVGLLFIIMPILLITASVTVLLVFIIIGIPLLLILVPAIMNWMSFTYHDYILTKNGFFQAMGNGLQLLRRKFWPVTFATLLMLFIVQMIQGIVMLIPYIIGFVLILSGIDTVNQEDIFSQMSIFMGSMMVLTVFVSYVANNIILVSQGMMYYGLKEESENIGAQFTIEEIGSQS